MDMGVGVSFDRSYLVFERLPVVLSLKKKACGCQQTGGGKGGKDFVVGGVFHCGTIALQWL